MRCRNCGHADRFVLLVELAALVAEDASGPADAEWSLSVECPACASTDVTGDAGDLLGRALGRGP
ncbi:hypothetical protein [Halegenticoccus soli]|uniref:hypothetical protein n=1 Tax=Halegenticoccus soli TaxID=1985678 RepID=UPI000C6D24CD|nr:hypothetical protein [Halegenticoccus soli]